MIRSKAVRSLVLCICALLLPAALPAAAAEADAGPLAQRVKQVGEQVSAEPNKPEALFHADFLKAVPTAQLVGILKQYHAQGGAVTATTRTASKGEYGAEYRFTTENGSVFPVKIAVDPAPPHLITSLWFGLMQPAVKGPQEIVEKLKALPGRVSFALWRLDGEKPGPLYELEPDRELAIGSTFKLYVLGAFLAGIDHGSWDWHHVASLQEKWKSWPGGALQDWPEWSPVTLHTLAAQMISISDNTATDHLLFLMGRDKVEQVLEPMGHSKPALDVPFLSTREMLRIKETGKSAERVAAWAGLDPAARRGWLEGLNLIDRKDFAGIDQLHPTAIGEVEWFASAADLCRAMDWFRKRPAVHRNGGGRAILAINRGLEFDDAKWLYVGYKGGSEPGVLNMTWLLEREDGAWFALSAGWNDPQARLDEKRFFALIQSLIELLADPAKVSSASAAP